MNLNSVCEYNLRKDVVIIRENERIEIERTVCELSSIISNIATACFLSLSLFITTLYLFLSKLYCNCFNLYVFRCCCVLIFLLLLVLQLQNKKFFFLSVSIYKCIYTLNISLFHNVRIVEFIRCVFRFFLSCCYYMLSLYSRERERKERIIYKYL